MSAPMNEFVAAIIVALKADATVAGLIDGRIFDEVPESKKNDYPRVTFGSDDEVPENLDCLEVSEYSLQIDVWSKKASSKECREITSAIRKVLLGGNLSLATHALAYINVDQARHFKDANPAIKHGVISIDAEIEER